MNVLEILRRAASRASSSVFGLQRAADGSRSLQLVELEDRVMLSATPLSAAVEPVMEQSATMLSEDGGTLEAEPVSEAAPEQNSETDSTIARELVFVDASVEDYQQLLDDLWSSTDSNRDLDVVLLSSQRNGIEQITETLSQYTDEKLDVVHFLSHGTDRAIKLGDEWFDSNAFAEQRVLVESWSHALNSGADLLFYGCDLASDVDGQTLLQNIATATGADSGCEY